MRECPGMPGAPQCPESICDCFIDMYPDGGSPYVVRPVNRFGQYPYGWRVIPEPSVARAGHVYHAEADAVSRTVELFRREAGRPSWSARIAELRGRDLACWCPLDQPCHADVLLELANGADDA